MMMMMVVQVSYRSEVSVITAGSEPAAKVDGEMYLQKLIAKTVRA